MLKDNNNHSACFSADDLMAYLYGEVAETELGRMDRHLAGCGSCTDDFAAISESRFSIYEWRQTDFADIATPMIDGPWNETPVRSLRSEPLAQGRSLGERLRSIVPSLPTWAFAMTAAVIVAAVVWIGFANLRHSSDKSAAIQQKRSDQPVQGVSPQFKQTEPEKDVALDKPSPHGTDSSKTPVTAQLRKPARQPANSTVAANRNPGVRHRSIMGLNGRRQEVASSFRRVPNLSGIEEDEDRTVRLADLFAEVGSDNENN
ncbi:MAG: zf-HC2 domain-containing protein [Acidobacteriota bacterium]